MNKIYFKIILKYIKKQANEILSQQQYQSLNEYIQYVVKKVNKVKNQKESIFQQQIEKYENQIEQMNQHIQEITDLYNIEQQNNKQLQQKSEQDNKEFQEYQQLLLEEQEQNKIQQEKYLQNLQEDFESQIHTVQQEVQKLTETNKDLKKKLMDAQEHDKENLNQIQTMQEQIKNYQEKYIEQDEFQKLKQQYFEISKQYHSKENDLFTLQQSTQVFEERLQKEKQNSQAEIQELLQQNLDLQEQIEKLKEKKKDEITIERESFYRRSFGEMNKSFNIQNFENQDDIPEFQPHYQDNTMDYLDECQNCQSLLEQHKRDYRKFLEESQNKNAEIILLQQEILKLKQDMQQKQQEKIIQDKSSDSVSNMKLSRVASRQQLDNVQENLLKKVIDIEQVNKDLQKKIKYITKQQLKDTGYYKTQTQTLYSILIQTLQND